MISSFKERLWRHEATGAAVLLAAAVLALAMSNSPVAGTYRAILDFPISIGGFSVGKPLHFFITDGFMTLFFLIVGLELKREVLNGHLSSARRALLPLITAAGGMAAPAAIYVLINAGNAETLRGWAIPSATDIAFAVGVLALLGPRVPASLRSFLLALAIADDLGAIVILALFYSHDFEATAFWLSVTSAAVLFFMNRAQVQRLLPFALGGAVLWTCLLHAGVHPTLSGVMLACALPMSGRSSDLSLAHRVETALKGWVQFLIAPLFAFANAGVPIQGLSPTTLLAPVPLGIACGLFLGKQIGIFSSAWLAIRLGMGDMPTGTTWRHIYGVAVLGGIGFTMSLFIGNLAFPDPADAAHVRAGVLFGSVVSAVWGYAVLRCGIMRILWWKSWSNHRAGS